MCYYCYHFLKDGIEVNVKILIQVVISNQTVSGKRTTCRNGETGNMGAVSDDGSSGIEDGLRELHNSTGESKTMLG